VSAEQAVGIAVGVLLLGAFLLFAVLLLAGKQPVKQPVRRKLDCGCRSSTIVGCLTCGRTACQQHQQHEHDPVDEQADGYQRAQYFTEEVMAAGPSIVAGQDLDDSLLIAELQQAYARYRAGEDVYAGAPKESV
jgi:hypothetical protein